MPSASVQAMSMATRARSSNPSLISPQSLMSTPSTSLNIPEFILEDESYSHDSTRRKAVSEAAFIRAQREAFQAFNDAALARAIRASEETAALEEAKRQKEALLSYQQKVALPSSSSLRKESIESAKGRVLLSDNESDDPPRSSHSSKSYRQSPPNASGPSPPSRSSVRLRTDSTSSQRRHNLLSAQSKQDADNREQPLQSRNPSASVSRASSSAQQQVSTVNSKSQNNAGTISTSPSTNNSSLGQKQSPSLSARDLRMGMSMGPIVNGVHTPNVNSKRKGIATDPESLENRGLFTGTRDCTNCGNPILSPRYSPTESVLLQSQLITNLIHLSCSKCFTNHCRGCFTVTSCPRNCKSGDSCSVKSCCAKVRTIAIFEALSSFDIVYATEAGLFGQGTKQERQDFIKLVIGKTDKRTRDFEGAFLRTLRIICSWLQASSYEETPLHPSMHRLFAVSYLREVIYIFLSNNNVRDWVAHSEIYATILEALRRMVDCGLAQVLTEQLENIDHSCGLQRWIWDQGPVLWESDSHNEPTRSPPLFDLVKQLEAHRRPLMALGAKVQFSATIEKVNSLCDGISYLLLQQVMEG